MPRQPSHIRNGRIVGNTRHLNSKAIKVLAKIKFSPTSVSREDLIEKTSLTKEDVTRQVKLLLNYNLIKTNSRFPQFPNQGWRVYTSSLEHNKIMGILREHGYRDEATESGINACNGYHPTGMDLEGLGVQPNRGRSYPSGVPINEDLSYRPETIRVMEEWRDRIKPFRPKEYSQEAIKEKLKKFKWLSDKLSAIYHINPPKIKVGTITEETWNTPGSSGSSYYNLANHSITINGKFSVITFIHEFGHSRGFDEIDTTMWSVNLFKRIFPVSFSKLQGQGHMLQQNQEQRRFSI